MIPELELPNSKNKKEEPPKMKNITPDQHRQRLGIFIASIFAFTLGFIFFELQQEQKLDSEWKEFLSSTGFWGMLSRGFRGSVYGPCGKD